MFVLLSFVLFVLASVSANGVYIKYGEVTVDGYEVCVFENNNMQITYKAMTPGFQVDYLLFGLVTYHCDNHSGTIISNFECKPCGLFCVYNQQMEKCKHIFIPYLIGFLIGLIISVAMAIFLVKLCKKTRPHATSIWHYWRAYKSDQKKIRRATELKEMVGLTPNVNFETIDKRIKPKHAEKIEAKRANFAVANCSLYPSLAMQVFIIFGLLSVVFGCDNSLFVSSNGKICEKDKCKDIETVSLPIQTGKTICFKDTDANILEISVIDTYYKTKYMHVYDTTEFTIQVESKGMCGYNNYCTQNECHKGKRLEVFENKTGLVEGFTCETKSNCDSYCFKDTSCTYGHWWLNEVDAPAKVYKKVSKIWEVKMKIVYKETVKYFILNLNKPSFQIDNVDSQILNNLPMFFNSFMGEDYTGHSYVIQDYGKFYAIEASELNYPEADKIGDYQKEIVDSKKSIYNTNYVDCQADYCEMTCSTPESKLKRFRKSNKYSSEIISYELKGDHQVEEHQKIQATFNVLFGNVNIASLEVERAQCNIDKISSYGCTGCNMKPYVIFRATQIKKQGIIPFESNCTFNRNYLSCSSEPFTLEIDDVNAFCYMYMPSLNRTLYIKTDIEYVGNLDPSNPEFSSESAFNIAKQMLVNKDMATALTYTVAGTTMFGVLLTAMVRILQIVSLRKEGKDVEDHI